MNYDFDRVQTMEEPPPMPPGRYLCRVGEVREGTTQSGDSYWSLRLEVAEGDEAGRTAGWDNLVFSDRGAKRARFVLENLGVEVRGAFEMEPHELVGRRVVAHFVAEQREDPILGRTTRLRVPWTGYEPPPVHDGPFSQAVVG